MLMLTMSAYASTTRPTIAEMTEPTHMNQDTEILSMHSNERLLVMTGVTYMVFLKIVDGRHSIMTTSTMDMATLTAMTRIMSILNTIQDFKLKSGWNDQVLAEKLPSSSFLPAACRMMY
jgi:hypothetical protein